MAGNKENRELGYEVKQMRKMLSEFDAQIRIPDSIQSSALLEQLDDDPLPEQPVERKSRIFRLPGWQSALTYAAAFVLIVGLFYGLGLDQAGETVQGVIELPQQEEAVVMELEADNFDLELLGDELHDTEAPGTYNQQGAEPAEGSISAGMDGGAGVPTQPRMLDAAEEDSAAPASMPMGGGGESGRIGEQNGYAYTWRQNDASDPDKGEYPLTIDIVEQNGEKLAAQIDLPAMLQVQNAHLSEQTLVLVGDVLGGVAVYGYDIANPHQPESGMELFQSGAYVGSRSHRNVVSVVTYLESSDEVQSPVAEQLPGAVEGGICVISVLDAQTGLFNQKAYRGASEKIDLFDLNAYITYQGIPGVDVETSADDAPQDADNRPDPNEEESFVTYTAQIRLSGTDISLDSIY